jgi:hypothetical protein
MLSGQLADRREDGRHRNVHPNVDRTQLALDLIGRRLDSIGVGNVGRDRQCTHAEAAQLGRCMFQPVFVA